MAQPQRQRETAKKVLAAEAIAQKLLRQSVNQVAKQAAATGMNPAHAGLLVDATARLALAKVQDTVRERAAVRFEEDTSVHADESVAKDTRTAKAARGLGRSFAEETRAALVGGMPIGAAYVAAAKALRPDIHRTATTEVMAAWNGETRRQAKVSRVDVVLTWHAELDACEECFSFDGITARNGEQFPQGDPPLHPHCKCVVEATVDEGSAPDGN